MIRFLQAFVLAFTYSTAASAYIGPGVGAGAAAVVFGIIASVAIAFFAILWYPFKRVLKKRRKKRATAESHVEELG